MAEESQPLAYVQETVLKKRKGNEALAITRRERLEQHKKRRKEDLKFVIKRPEQFVKEYRLKELDHIQMKHRLKMRKLPSNSLKSELIFVIRICGSNDMHPKTRENLNFLRLKRVLNGVFVKASDGILKLLLSVEPFITYGYPNLKSVRELILKKGCGKIHRQRVPLTNNDVIEEALGKYGLICIEDIVHEIATVGSHFKEVTKFLWPFKLKPPEGHVQLKKKPYKDGGDSGNREDKINELIDKLN